MSLRKIAKELGVSHSYLSQIRTGKRPLPERLREKLKAIGAYHLLTSGKQTENASQPVNGETLVELRGFEPLTPCLQSRCSPD